MANVRRVSRGDGVHLRGPRLVQRIGIAHHADSHGDFAIAREIRCGLYLSIVYGLTTKSGAIAREVSSFSKVGRL